MERLAEILERNRAWAERRAAGDPEVFARLARRQHPDLLWIGCADSRVPPSVVAGLEPGEAFVHRNVANLVPPGDANVLAALEYAVETLGVAHVIVCGHYGCGGIAAALTPRSAERRGSAAEAWLRGVREVADRHTERLERQPDDAARERLLCELNALEQARNVARSGVVRRARERGARPAVHAWIYDLADGRLRDLGFSGAEAADRSAASAGDAR